jgi:large subunit ribosomal protein L10
MLSQEEKIALAADLRSRLQATQGIVIAEYRGLTVAELSKLRKEAHRSAVFLKVLKNNVVRKAIADTPFVSLESQLQGPLLYAFSSDPVSAAKVITTYAKTNPKLVIKGGGLPFSALTAEGVDALASLPSKEELIAKLLATMQAPIGQFVRTLHEVPSRFVRVLAAIQEKSESH